MWVLDLATNIEEAAASIRVELIRARGEVMPSDEVQITLMIETLQDIAIITQKIKELRGQEVIKDGVSVPANVGYLKARNELTRIVVAILSSMGINSRNRPTLKPKESSNFEILMQGV